MCAVTKVSVIIPVYNIELYLRQCIDSVVNQTLKDIEIICVNDGSTDGSSAILEEYAKSDERIVVINQENQGAGCSRNNGMAIAKGEYLSFLDSDDFFELDMLEKMYEKSISENSDITICRSRGVNNRTSDVLDMDWSLKKGYLPDKEVFSCKDIPKYIFQFCVGWSWDKLYRNDFVKSKNLKFQKIHHSNDTFFTLFSLASADRITCLDDILINHRYHKNSLEKTRYLQPNCFYYALQKLEMELIDYGIYEDVKQSFVNYCLEFSFWHINNMRQTRVKKLLTAKFVEMLKTDINFEQYPAEYFYKKCLYKNAVALCENKNQKFSIHDEISEISGCEYKVITFLRLKFKVKKSLISKIFFTRGLGL